MKIKIKTFIALLIALGVFIMFVSIVRPVGWFDSVFALVMAVIAFFFVKNFKGFMK
jgi:membrane associated rhomboid family serine protease